MSEERKKFLEANKRMQKNKKEYDTLSKRISAKKELTENEIEELMSVLTSGCRQKTKNIIRFALNCVPDIQNFGIFERVHLKPYVSYCAGQSYPDEIRTVRELLKGF